MRNFPLTFGYSRYSQKLGEDFAKFCGLLRIFELYFTYQILFHKKCPPQDFIIKTLGSLLYVVENGPHRLANFPAIISSRVAFSNVLCSTMDGCSVYDDVSTLDPA